MSLEQGRQGRDEGIAHTTAKHPEAMARALNIVCSIARQSPELDSNLVRGFMEEGEVPGPVRGGAWREAIRLGLITPVGYVPSSLSNTHAHPVKRYTSHIYWERCQHPRLAETYHDGREWKKDCLDCRVTVRRAPYSKAQAS